MPAAESDVGSLRRDVFDMIRETEFVEQFTYLDWQALLAWIKDG